jgi:hypothetical protein
MRMTICCLVAMLLGGCQSAQPAAPSLPPPSYHAAHPQAVPHPALPESTIGAKVGRMQEDIRRLQDRLHDTARE